MKHSYPRVLRKLRPPKIESGEIWSQIVIEIGLICQIIFCLTLSTKFSVKFNGRFRGLSFRNFENKDPS